MILQLKYKPIVMNPARIASSDWNPRNAMVCDTPYLENELGDARFFLRFQSNFIIFYLQSKFKKNLCVGTFGREHPLIPFSGTLHEFEGFLPVSICLFL